MAVSTLMWCIKPLGPRRWSPKVVPEIWKNVHIQQKLDIWKIRAWSDRNSRKTLKIYKNLNIQKNWTFEKFGGNRKFWKNVKKYGKR